MSKCKICNKAELIQVLKNKKRTKKKKQTNKKHEIEEK